MCAQGRPGLLRTVLEAQETRGLTRSDDISRLLPSEAANMARGRRIRQSKLLFFAKARLFPSAVLMKHPLSPDICCAVQRTVFYRVDMR